MPAEAINNNAKWNEVVCEGMEKERGNRLKTVERALSLPAPLHLQFLPQLFQGQRVDHIVLGEPAFAGDTGAQA